MEDNEDYGYCYSCKHGYSDDDTDPCKSCLKDFFVGGGNSPKWEPKDGEDQ